MSVLIADIEPQIVDVFVCQLVVWWMTSVDVALDDMLP